MHQTNGEYTMQGTYGVHISIGARFESAEVHTLWFFSKACCTKQHVWELLSSFVVSFLHYNEPGLLYVRANIETQNKTINIWPKKRKKWKHKSWATVLGPIQQLDHSNFRGKSNNSQSTLNQLSHDAKDVKRFVELPYEPKLLRHGGTNKLQRTAGPNPQVLQVISISLGGSSCLRSGY